MSHPVASAAGFAQASISFKDLSQQLGEDFAVFKSGSREVLQNFYDDFQVSWEKWSQASQKYQVTIKQLPKELRQRPFIKNAIANINSFEADLKDFLQKFKNSSLQEWRQAASQHLKVGSEKIQGIQLGIQKISCQISEIETNALVQKCLRGETILADIKNIQWARKLSHAFLGVLFLFLFVYSGWSPAIIWTFAGAFMVFCFSLETLRHFNPSVNQWVWRAFKPIMRESEKTKINSAMFYIFSMAVVYFVFPLQVAVVTMLFIAIGDPVASIVGLNWGKTKLAAHVSLEGFLACFFTCALMAYVSVAFIFTTSLHPLLIAGFSLLGGLTGALAECSFKKLDDNLTMPLLSAPVLWVLMQLFGIL